MLVGLVIMHISIIFLESWSLGYLDALFLSIDERSSTMCAATSKWRAPDMTIRYVIFALVI
jgi:hypothetical protein